MTLGHFIYIPGVLLLGAVIGYVLGGRMAEAARGADGDKARRAAARDARRQSRDQS